MKVRELRTYVNHCHAMLRDVDHVIHDHECEKTLETWYAVDFSEIFNYVLPYASHERAPFADSWSEDPLRQFYVLSQFFGRRKIVLLEPYAVELRGFFDRLLANEYDYVEDVIGPTMEEFKPLLASDEVNELRALAPQPDLTEAQVERAIRFFETHAPALVGFARGADLLPLDRLKKLLHYRPFTSLEALAPGAITNVKEQNVRRIFNLLAPTRGNVHAGYLDALAIEHVRLANKALLPQKKRLLLVSRSSAMMAAVETLSRQREWEGVEVFVRHPRSFSAAYRPAGRDDAFFMDELKLRRESLDVFANAATESIKSDTAEQDTEISSGLRELVEKLQTDWTSVEALATALVEQGELPVKDSTALKSPRRLAHELLTFLRDPEKDIYKQALSRLHEIFNELRRERALLGVEMHTATAHEDSKGIILYSIEFESLLLQARMRELASLWRVDIEDAAKLWDFEDDGSIHEYERMLAMSVSLGAINHWKVADRYIAFALLLGKQSNISLHEGQFFRAVCLRKNLRRSYELRRRRIDEALAALDEAERTRQKKQGTAEDARYMKERAVLWMERRKSIRIGAHQTDIPTIEAIAELLLYALRLANDDEKLRIQIYNNLCYLYIDFADPIDRENTQKYLKLLTDLLEKHGSIWPSFLEDTVIWAEFQLRPPTVSPRLLDHWAERLRIISTHPDLTQQESEEIQRHLSHVASAIVSSQSEDTWQEAERRDA